MNPTPTANDTCAYDRCECVVSGSDAIKRDGQTYCSKECADGVGCDHESCNCRRKE